MTYTATSNSLASEVANVPGVVLGVSPTNSTVVVNDQLRGVLYLYTPRSGAYTSFAGIGQKATFTADGQTVYIVGNGVLYIHNVFTGWSVETLPANQATPTTGICPATNTTSPIPTDPTSYPPNTTANPNNTYNMFCSPDAAVTIPASAVFLSGTTTAAYGQCPETTVTPVVNYPEAATVAAVSDHVASTTDGKHIIGASANPAVLTDLSITVPIDACPSDANGQTTGIDVQSAPRGQSNCRWLHTASTTSTRWSLPPTHWKPLSPTEATPRRRRPAGRCCRFTNLRPPRGLWGRSAASRSPAMRWRRCRESSPR